MLTDPEQEPPISSEAMLDVCRRFTKGGEYQGLVDSTLDPDSPDAPGLCRPFRDWEKSLRNELVILRAAEQNLNSEDYFRETEPVFGTSSVAAEAMTKDSPLEAEIFLDRCRWSKIDELAMGHFFDIEFLRSYRMKLQILERRALFDEERGFAAYRDLYNRVLSASGTDIPTGGDNE